MNLEFHMGGKELSSVYGSVKYTEYYFSLFAALLRQKYSASFPVAVNQADFNLFLL
jgi:hypothetical protein